MGRKRSANRDEGISFVAHQMRLSIDSVCKNPTSLGLGGGSLGRGAPDLRCAREGPRQVEPQLARPHGCQHGGSGLRGQGRQAHSASSVARPTSSRIANTSTVTAGTDVSGTSAMPGCGATPKSAEVNRAGRGGSCRRSSACLEQVPPTMVRVDLGIVCTEALAPARPASGPCGHRSGSRPSRPAGAPGNRTTALAPGLHEIERALLDEVRVEGHDAGGTGLHSARLRRNPPHPDTVLLIDVLPSQLSPLVDARPP